MILPVPNVRGAELAVPVGIGCVTVGAGESEPVARLSVLFPVLLLIEPLALGAGAPRKISQNHPNISTNSDFHILPETFISNPSLVANTSVWL